MPAPPCSPSTPADALGVYLRELATPGGPSTESLAGARIAVELHAVARPIALNRAPGLAEEVCQEAVKRALQELRPAGSLRKRLPDGDPHDRWDMVCRWVRKATKLCVFEALRFRDRHLPVFADDEQQSTRGGSQEHGSTDDDSLSLASSQFDRYASAAANPRLVATIQTAWQQTIDDVLRDNERNARLIKLIELTGCSYADGLRQVPGISNSAARKAVERFRRRHGHDVNVRILAALRTELDAIKRDGGELVDRVDFETAIERLEELVEGEEPRPNPSPASEPGK